MDWSKITEQVNKIKVKNVVDIPLFYLLWILVLAIITSIFKCSEWITITLFSFAGILLILSLFSYLYFAFKNPDYLRSEVYNLKKQSLEILGDKDNLMPIDAKNIVEITNPYPLQLEEAIEDSK